MAWPVKASPAEQRARDHLGAAEKAMDQDDAEETLQRLLGDLKTAATQGIGQAPNLAASHGLQSRSYANTAMIALRKYLSDDARMSESGDAYIAASAIAPDGRQILPVGHNGSRRRTATGTSGISDHSAWCLSENVPEMSHIA